MSTISGFPYTLEAIVLERRLPFKGVSQREGQPLVWNYFGNGGERIALSEIIALSYRLANDPLWLMRLLEESA